MLYKVIEQFGPNGHVYFRLGVMYNNGHYVKKNPKVAKHYFRAALQLLPITAHQGDPETQCDLGYMYSLACGVTKNKERAIKYYRKAADAGFARGQYNLALSYKNGEGIERSETLAAHYYYLSAQQGDADAQYNLGIMYDDGDGIPKDRALALQFMQMAADQGHDYAQYNLGTHYDQKKDVETALKFYLAVLHDQDAQERLNQIFGDYGSDNQCRGNNFLSKEWPKYHHVLHPDCRSTILDIFLIIPCTFSLPKELVVLIVKMLVRMWPHPHVVLCKPKFKEDADLEEEEHNTAVEYVM